MTAAQRERYSRQTTFAPIGVAGQESLLRSRVAIIGCGALGSFQAAALARAGVGRLRLIDRDYIEWNNLQRQWLFEEADAEAGLPKAVAAARRLSAINSGVTIEPEVADLTAANADELLGASDLLLDGTDNFETRYLINDYSVARGIPWIYGAAVGSYGLMMPVAPGVTGCLKCMYPEPPSAPQETCETAGVVNTVTAVIAALQASEAIKILTGGEPSTLELLTTVDVWAMNIRQVRRPPADPDCPACGHRQFPHLEGATRAPISLCGRNAVQIHERNRPLDLGQLRERLAELGEVRANEFALRFHYAPYQMTIFADGRAIIKGTIDMGIARSLYARFVGI